jgi:hypothetical protein
MNLFTLRTRWTAASVPLFAVSCLCLWGAF